MAVQQALNRAGPLLLEPVMQADVHIEEEALGAVLADFTRRRGTVGEINLNTLDGVK